MLKSRKYAQRAELEQAATPIRYLTENGFTIVRRSEIDRSVIDTAGACHFIVQRERGRMHDVIVGFDENLITRLQVRRRLRLSTNSMLWLVCAESCLATYLWEHNHYPPDGQLIIGDLCPDDFMLAIHWQD